MKRRNYNRQPEREPRFCECGDHAFVWLTQGMVALIDPEDAPLIEGRKWCALKRVNRTFHAVRTDAVTGTVHMGRLIMSAPKGLNVDHRNHDCLDNRKRNLRVCSHAENMRNVKTSRPVKGAYFIEDRNKWMVVIAANKKRKTLGYFDTAEEAATVYDEAARRLHGEYAMTNADIQAMRAERCLDQSSGQSSAPSSSSATSSQQGPTGSPGKRQSA